jgi:hypothetical protein
VLVQRSVEQDQGSWQVDYQLRNNTATSLTLSPSEIGARVEGWVSNSRISSHALPRWSSAEVVPGGEQPAAIANVIDTLDEKRRCRERLAVAAWSDDLGPTRGDSPKPGPASSKTASASTSSESSATESIVRVPPGGLLRVRLRLEHLHAVFGNYDPLLGARRVELSLAGQTIQDNAPLDREQYQAQPKFTWPEPPEDRRDPRYFRTGPDSLHLEAHVPGHQYYRFPDHPVRYGTKMRLRFWYLIAEGTEGDCRVRLSQIRETDVAWRQLSEGTVEHCLNVVGRWTPVERIIRLEPEATIVGLEFKIISDTYVGEMWIDDISFEPLSAAPAGP